MKKRIKDLWVAALRSGKYRQARGALHKKGHGREGYCCLGVLCEIAVKHNVIPPGRRDGDVFVYRGKNYMWLPDSVVKWAGLKTNAAALPKSIASDDGAAMYFTLAEYNDAGKTFKTIANVIEDQYKHL